MLYQNKYEEALLDFEKAIELSPDYFEAYTSKGKVLFNLNKKDQAIQDYSRAIEINPNYVEAYSNRGSNLGQYTLGILSLDQNITCKTYNQI